MSKRVHITPEIQATIRKAIGDMEADTSKLVVFEARFVSTEPITKGGIFHKARISASTLNEMQTFLNKDGGAIPLHIMHNDKVLPVGKVFNSRTMTLPNGEVELRGQFYIPEDNAKLVSDIENSVVDEVSVGLLTKHIYCSECNFDYRSEDADIMNFLTMTCENGHQIGVDGVHTRLVGLDDWTELSVVGQGAAHNAKILSRAKQSMSKEMVERLAASKDTLGACILTASYKMEDNSNSTTQGDSEMDVKEFTAQLTAVSSELGEVKAALSQSTKSVETLNTELTALKASIADKDAKIAELEAAKGQDLTALETKLSKAEKDLKDATDKLAPHVKAALVASGVAETEVPADLLAQVKLVEDKGLKLHQIIGSTARTDDGKGDVMKLSASDYRKEAFKLSGK